MRSLWLANARVSSAGVVAILLVVAAAGHAAADQGLQRPLLDVPYVTQIPELCGGAAVAMVLRYWGERDVFAQDFAPLVVPAERGIPTGALAAAVRNRSWQALVLPADAVEGRKRIGTEVDQGRPLIALIEVAPRQYHYVVLVGVTDDEVVLHDPARAPFRVMRWSDFDRAWAAAERWLLLVVPPETRSSRATTEPTSAKAAPVNITPCGALVDQGVTLALNKENGAEEALVAATHLCPADAAAWRELGGWRFSQSRWAEAETHSARALRLAPGDEHARRWVATSRYRLGERGGALKAWTPRGEPRIDAINVHGVTRMPHPVVVRATALQPRQVLTARRYARALRRLDALPIVSSARLHYEPLENGVANVEAFLVERDTFPKGWVPLLTIAGRAALNQELRFHIAGALRAGELLSASWRWKKARPAVAVGLSVPAPSWLPGVVSVQGLWERQSYGVPEEESVVREARRRAALSLADWATSRVRWTGGVAYDRFDTLETAATEAGLDVRLKADHIALGASAGGWVPFDGSPRFGATAVRAAWRSTDKPAEPLVGGVVGFTHASRSAPLALWGAAGLGSSRGTLLRAHRLIEDDVLIGKVFGRRIANGTVEYAHPIFRAFSTDVALAAFVDAAQAWQGLPGADLPLLVDAGLGFRVSSGRTDSARIDVAHGLRGGGTRASITWARAWPW